MYFFLDLDAGPGRGAVDTASLRGRPRGRLSVEAGLPVGVAPVLPGGGDGPLSEVSRLLSSDDILEQRETHTQHGVIQNTNTVIITEHGVSRCNKLCSSFTFTTKTIL